MKTILCRTILAVTLLTAGFGLAACGDNVEGNTYTDAEGVISLQFLSGGKANFKMGPVGGECTYNQSGKAVTVTCNGVAQVFNVNDDGSLGGPASAIIGKLTKKK
jgi:hypothetical protein